MTNPPDAGFMDPADGPLRLGAISPEDVTILSALVQDAVFTLQDTQWDKKSGQFSILINRLRHEAQVTTPERARAVLSAQNVTSVVSHSLDFADKSKPSVILSITHNDGETGKDVLTFNLAGGAALRLHATAVQLVLRDVTRPYVAPSGKRPDHS